MSRRRAVLCAAGALAGFGSACARGPEVIVHAADGRGLTAKEVDGAPLSLLPPEALGWLNVDLGACQQTALGRRVVARFSQALPLPPRTQCVIERDVERLWMGFYAAQSFDAAGVAHGRFAPELWRAATGPGELARSEYAGREVYSVGGLSVCLLTSRTALFGSPSGIVRCLDRIRDRRVATELPEWVRALIEAPRAQFAGGVDAAKDSLAALVASRLPAVSGVRRLSGVGNFAPPGLNVAMTLSCSEAAQAPVLEATLQQAAAAANVYGQLLGWGQTLSQVETRVVGPDLQAGAAWEERALVALLDRLLLPGVLGGAPAGASVSGGPA